MDRVLPRRTELLEEIVETLLQHGAADLSLRPLAERVGTSARLLIYHFGSKDELIAAALAELRSKIAASLHARAQDVRPDSLRALVMMVWDWATEAANQSFFRLLFEVDGLALYDRVHFSEEARKANSAVWIGLISRGAERWGQAGVQFTVNSTLIVAALSGLLQEFLSTGDRDATTAALSTLMDLLSGERPSGQAKPGLDT